jgi:hypothetical protein
MRNGTSLFTLAAWYSTIHHNNAEDNDESTMHAQGLISGK